MACCLTVPSHYLKQCWHFISGFLCHSCKSDFTARAQITIMWNEFENYTFRFIATSPRGNELMLRNDRKCKYTFLFSQSNWAQKGLKVELRLCYLSNKNFDHKTFGLELGPNCHHFADIFICIFLAENVCIFIEISLKFVSYGEIGNKSALVPIMAWHLPGAKPLLEPMLTLYQLNWYE